MNMKFTHEELSITWRMWVVIFMTSFGIYLGGVTSGYFIARSEYAMKANQRDVVVGGIQKKLDALPRQTATEVNKVVKEDEAK